MMGLPKVLEFARILISERVAAGDIAVDATCGNGHDTVFLADLVGEQGKVYAFDIQEKAVINTLNRVKDNGLSARVICKRMSHEFIEQVVEEPVKGAMFNLGYLPNSDKLISTKSSTTIAAIQGLLNRLAIGGIITIILYIEHDQGHEAQEVEEYLTTLKQKNFTVLNYRFLNQVHFPPYLIAIEKVSEETI